MPENVAIETNFVPERDLGSIFSKAVALKTSDIHIVPFKGGLLHVKYRVDGKLETHRIIKCDDELREQIASKIKVLGELRVDESRVPQDGRITVTIGGKETYMRISTMPTVNGEKIVVRLLGSATDLTLDNLGLLSTTAAKVRKYLEESHGMILVVGATGSGKSTTLQAMLRSFNTEETSIATLEDPVEYQIPGVAHSQVNHKAGFDFATGLRSLLRQDPDVIMVGEVRDAETAKLCAEAAITGHLVFSTLHANTAVATVQRLLSLGVDPYVVISGLRLVVAQRLARRLCVHCKEAYDPDPATRDRVRKVVGQHVQVGTMFKMWRAKEGGCEQCGGRGTRGRVGFYEALEMTNVMKKLVLEKASEAWMAEKARDEGMITMAQDAVIKALAGEVSVDEVNLQLGPTV